MDNPKVSVVISTYNRADRLRKAIQSVLNQTFQDYEIIVVDDCSPDNKATEKVVDEFQKGNIIYTRLQNNFGNDTRPKNVGTKLARGQYIAYLDDDNEYRPDHLMALVRELDMNPDIDGVYGDRWIDHEDNDFIPQIGIAYDYYPKLLLQKNYIDTSDVLIRREAIFDVGGWDERYKKYVDWNLWVRMAKAGKVFKRVQLILTDYHLHKSMKSLTVKDKHPNGMPSIPLGSAPVVNPEWNPFEVEIDLPYLHEVKEPRVAIFTITHREDRLPILQKCMTTLREKAGYPYYHVFIINGALPETVKWLKEVYKPDYIIDNGENKGLAIASNQAVDHLKDQGFDVIMKVDDDMLTLTNDLLKELVGLYKKNHMMLWSAYPEGLIANAGGAPRIAYGTLGKHFIGHTNHVGGFCQFMPAKARIAARLPEDTPPHWFDDLYLSQWLGRNGYGIAYVEDMRVRHVLADYEKK